MALVLKTVFVSDQYSEVIEKFNYNFSQLKLNSGGEQGLPGKDSTKKGEPGIRGVMWYDGEGDPNLLIFTDLLEKDLYIDKYNGDIWRCTNHVIPTWEITQVNLTGPKGDSLIDPNYNQTFYNFDDSTSHFYYTAVQDFGLGIIDLRSIVFGGYIESSKYFSIPDLIKQDLNPLNGLTYFYTPGGIKQIKFLTYQTTSVEDAPSIYSFSNDILKIENNRVIIDKLVQDGIQIETFDSNISLNSKRDIYITAYGNPNITYPFVDEISVGNINIISTDYITNNYPNSNYIKIINKLDNTNSFASIELNTIGDKELQKYISLTSNSDDFYSNITISTNINITTDGYFYLNNTQAINAISNDGSFALNSDYIIPTQKAIKTYTDIHKNSTGDDHTWIDQPILTTSSPKFNKIYLNSNTSYITTTYSNSITLIGNNRLFIGGTSGELFINDIEPALYSPNKYTFNNGSNNTYADIEAKSFIANGDINLKSFWLKNESANGIKINENGNVGIRTEPNNSYYLNVAGSVYLSSIFTNRIQIYSDNSIGINNDEILELNSTNNFFCIGNSINCSINNTIPTTGESVQNWIWNAGNNITYASHEMNNLILHGSITMSNNWIYSGNIGSIYIRDDGNVGIKSVGSPDYALNVYGKMYVSGSILGTSTNSLNAEKLNGTGIKFLSSGQIEEAPVGKTQGYVHTGPCLLLYSDVLGGWKKIMTMYPMTFSW